MADPTGESTSKALRLNFDRRLLLQFRGSVIASDGGLLAYRELDDVLGLTTNGGGRLAEARTGRNRRHLLVGLPRQSVFGRLAGYEDVNDAERLWHGYAIRLPTNPVLQDKIGHLLKCPVGRPLHEVRRYYASFRYQAQSWNKSRHVVAKVE
jgi:hypothetical protein